ncbi:Lycopene beta-cyclase, partial [Aureobasidium melanogenum]
MGFDYALVHVKYTVPPAIALTLLYRPLLTRLDVYKILFLVTIALVSTTPWDSYLIRTRIWSYPEDAVIGPKLFDIPLEEIFFFIIQTYNTSLLYLLFSKPTFHPIYLRRQEKNDRWKYFKLAGQLVLGLLLKKAVNLVKDEGAGTYMGLILVWAVPFLLLLWSLAYQFILGLPITNTLVPIALPTLYLWIVDTLALRRGTWVIESGTKLGTHLWPGLEIEEAVFFLLTNTLIVFGLVAFDNAVAILNAFPSHFPSVPALPSPVLLVQALLLPAAAYDDDRVEGLTEAVKRLHQKSRSFYLASAAFSSRLRVDLIVLYSFCRVADDLVDNAASPLEARKWIKRLRTFLDLSYKAKDPMAHDQNIGSVVRHVVTEFPRSTHTALLQLPTSRLSSKHLYDLLKGFEMDLGFQTSKGAQPSAFPIKSEYDLDTYSSRVAGTVAAMCIELVFFHYPGEVSPTLQEQILDAGNTMGIALQYTNIARDITTDALLNRVYLPTSWLKEENLTPEQAIQVFTIMDAKPTLGTEDQLFVSKLERLRNRLLERSFALYEDSRGAIDKLPSEVRGPMRVATESYMEIGRTLKQPGYRVRKGKATVDGWRRLAVAWKALQ